MKRAIYLVLILLTGSLSYSQTETYLIFEFMKVDNDQEQFYYETEEFWEKIHQERVNSGDIVGWDLWQLLPGGEDQGYQYLTVTVFDSEAKMMRAGEGILESAKMAYPDLSDEELDNRLNLAGGSRDLAVRLFLKVVDQANANYEMKQGMVTTLELMKSTEGKDVAYEKAEAEIFKPWHTEMIKNGLKGDWQLTKVLLPQGSDTYASHITVNMFDNWDHYIKSRNSGGEMSPAMAGKVEQGIKTRDMKYVYLAQLAKIIR